MLEIVDPGLLATIQDAGRTGFEDLGVPRSGACDLRSLAVANLLHGNQRGDPAIEITLGGLVARALEPCTVGLAGADLGASVDGERELRPGRVQRLTAGATLAFGGGRIGARAYLSLAGGIDVPAVLGSAATYLPTALGGLDGRALATGDRLAPVRRGDLVAAGRRWPGAEGIVDPGRRPLAIVPGPDAGRFGPAALERLTDATWTVRPESDRMGIRLDGPPIPGGPGELISTAMVEGAIQLPADGAPILLLADHQTVGGYPVLAVLASVDLPLAGQLRPGDPLRFELIGVAEAGRRLREAEADLRRAARAITADALWDELPLDARG